MAVTPSGLLSIPFASLRALLAASTTWQSVCGVATAAAALEFIHEFELPLPEEEQPPVFPAIVILDEDRLEQYRSWDADQRGQVLVEFWIPVTVTDDDPKALTRELQYGFRNLVSNIFTDTFALRGSSASYLSVIRWRKVVAPQEVTEAVPRFRTANLMWGSFIAEWV